MVYRGHIQDGAIILDDPGQLPDGASVEIRIIGANAGTEGPMERPWLKYSGIIDDLPPDASMRIDEVLYGRPEE